MKFFFTLMAVCIVLLWIVQGYSEVRANYQYENEIGSYWSLADKASTIKQKAEYIDKFMAAIDKAALSGNNAIFLTTPDNSAAKNIEAIKSLQSRLHEIQNMRPDSFEYQTAMQQITGQEQGEAHAVMEVVEGCWRLSHGYWYVWGWIDGLIWTASVIAAVIVGVAIFVLYVD